MGNRAGKAAEPGPIGSCMSTENTGPLPHKQWGASGSPGGKLQGQIYDPSLTDEEIGV